MWLYLRQWHSGNTDFRMAVSEVIQQGGECKKPFQMLKLNCWHANGDDYSLLISDAVMSNPLA